jgi:hypothetical protein
MFGVAAMAVQNALVQISLKIQSNDHSDDDERDPFPVGCRWGAGWW